MGSPANSGDGTDTSGLPRYEELPSLPGGGRTAWGVFGLGDDIGLLNLQTAETIVAAAALVRRGKRFPLDAPLDAVEPSPTGRGAPRHRVLPDGDGEINGFDDVYDNFYPQGSSQWDSLAHVAYEPDRFYNGVSSEDIRVNGRNTIDHWARRGIAARAVLLDVERSRASEGTSLAPDASTPITVEDLERARASADVEYSSGCVLLLRTGFLGWFLGQTRRHRWEFAQAARCPGLAHDETILQYLWDNRIAAVASDNIAVEVWPPDPSPELVPFGYLHRFFIGQLGLAIGELWHLDDLAEDCASDGVYECFLTSTPLHGLGGIGSPANALALK